MNGLAHYHLPRLRERSRLWTSHSLGEVARSLTSIFVPIYLYSIDYSLRQIFLYFAAVACFEVPIRLFGPRIVARIGANHSMVLGSLAEILFFLTLIFLPGSTLFLPILAIAAASSSFYWLGFHSNFSHSLHHHAESIQVSRLMGLLLLIQGLAPALAGIIGSSIGLGFVYGLALILIFVVGLILFKAREVVKPTQFQPEKLSRKEIAPVMFANACIGVVENSVNGLVWPLLVFLLIPSFAGVGALSSVIVLASLAITLYVGKRSLITGDRHFIKEGFSVNALVNILRALAQSPLHVFGINFIGGVANSLLTPSFATRYYYLSEKFPRLEYVSLTEAAHSAGRAIFSLILAALTVFIADPQDVLVVALLLSIPISFGVLRIK